jgi:hypothetical protein
MQVLRIRDCQLFFSVAASPLIYRTHADILPQIFDLNSDKCGTSHETVSTVHHHIKELIPVKSKHCLLCRFNILFTASHFV